MGAGLSKRSTNGGVGRRHSWAAQGTPRLVYNTFGGSFKQLRCITHEFGSQNKCHSENYLKQKGSGAIVGLHSNMIGDFILACARPSGRIIQEHHLIDQFKRQHIGAIVNLQKPGEHAGCGDGVDPESGFSYNPEQFEQENILYFNFPWKSSNFMDEKLALVICQTMGTQIATGAKVAVHCHSGIGRTGLVVACYLLFSGTRDSPMQAVQEVREDRPGTLTSKSQVELVKRFASYVVKLRIQFVAPDQRRKTLTGRGVKSYPTLVETMVRQNELLYGVERRALHYVPKVLDWLTRELIRRTEFNRDKREEIAVAFMEAFTTDLNLSPDDEFVQNAKARVNVGDWKGIEELETSVLCHLLLGWLCQLQKQRSPPERSSFVARLSTVNWVQSVYSKFKPSSLEIEFGFLLEATARFWIKLGVARHEEIENKGKKLESTSPGPSTGPLPPSFGAMPMKLRDRHQLGSFSQPWFRDRASLQYEQYNPGLALQHQEELEGRSSKPPFHSSTRGRKPVAVGTRKVEHKHKDVVQGDNLSESKKPADPAISEKAVVRPENKRPVDSAVENKSPTTPEIKTPVDHGSKKPVAPAQRKAVGEEEKKRVAHEESKPVASKAQKKGGA